MYVDEARIHTQCVFKRHRASSRRRDLSYVGVSVNQIVGVTLYAIGTYVRLSWCPRFCADDLDETLYVGSEEHDGEAVRAHLGGNAAQLSGERQRRFGPTRRGSNPFTGPGGELGEQIGGGTDPIELVGGDLEQDVRQCTGLSSSIEPPRVGIGSGNCSWRRRKWTGGLSTTDQPSLLIRMARPTSSAMSR